MDPSSHVLIGSDTTSNLLSWCLYALSQHPQVLAKCLAEIESIFPSSKSPSPSMSFDDLKKLPYLEATLLETLRLHPSVATTGRRCIKTHTLGKIVIPKGLAVVAPMFALHRSPRYWENPVSPHPHPHPRCRPHLHNPT